MRALLVRFRYPSANYSICTTGQSTYHDIGKLMKSLALSKSYEAKTMSKIQDMQKLSADLLKLASTCAHHIGLKVHQGVNEVKVLGEQNQAMGRTTYNTTKGIAKQGIETLREVKEMRGEMSRVHAACESKALAACEAKDKTLDLLQDELRTLTDLIKLSNCKAASEFPRSRLESVASLTY